MRHYIVFVIPHIQWFFQNAQDIYGVVPSRENVVLAESGDEAFKRVRPNKVDAVVIADNLPGDEPARVIELFSGLGAKIILVTPEADNYEFRGGKINAYIPSLSTIALRQALSKVGILA